MTARTRTGFLWTATILLAALLAAARMAAAETYDLESAVAAALANSAGLEMVRQQAVEAEARTREATAGFFPQVAIEAGYQYQSEVPTIEFSLDTPLGAIERSLEAGQNDNWQAGIHLTQPLFLGGALYYGRRAAVSGARAAEQTAGQVRSDLVAGVTAAFTGALLARESEQVLIASLENARRHLADVRNRFEAGDASRADVLKAEVQVNLLVPQLSQARELFARAIHGLRALMGLPEDAGLEVSGRLQWADVTAEPAEVQAEAARGRPEFQVIDARREAAADLVRAARAGWLPQVFARAAYQYQEPFMFQEDGQDYFTAAVGVNVPVFDGLAALARMDRHRAQVRQAEAARSAQENAVAFEVSDAVTRLGEVEQRIEATRGNVALAAEALEITGDGYRHGVMTNLDVLDANLRLLEARLAHLRAVYDHTLAKNDLNHACGRYATEGE